MRASQRVLEEHRRTYLHWRHRNLFSLMGIRILPQAKTALQKSKPPHPQVPHTQPAASLYPSEANARDSRLHRKPACAHVGPWTVWPARSQFAAGRRGLSPDGSAVPGGPTCCEAGVRPVSHSGSGSGSERIRRGPHMGTWHAGRAGASWGVLASSPSILSPSSGGPSMP